MLELNLGSPGFGEWILFYGFTFNIASKAVLKGVEIFRSPEKIRGSYGKSTLPTDLSDDEWDFIEPLIPAPKEGGRPRGIRIREVINAIFYIAKTGAQWRMLPKDFPPWQTVYGYFRTWRRNGTWTAIHDDLRAEVRHQAGKTEEPTAAIIDSQSLKCAEEAHKKDKGYDAEKKTNGRKRHLLVDTLGLILGVIVHPGSIQDRDSARLLLNACDGDLLERLQKIWADGGYAGVLEGWVKDQFGWILEIVRRSDHAGGLKVLPHRWIVERTFGWLNRYRRLGKDYERLIDSRECMVRICMIKLMLRRVS